MNSDEARTKRMLEIVEERDALKKLCVWQEKMLEEATAIISDGHPATGFIETEHRALLVKIESGFPGESKKKRVAQTKMIPCTHLCPDWDYLKITPLMPEFASCTCCVKEEK